MSAEVGGATGEPHPVLLMGLPGPPEGTHNASPFLHPPLSSSFITLPSSPTSSSSSSSSSQPHSSVRPTAGVQGMSTEKGLNLLPR